MKYILALVVILFMALLSSQGLLAQYLQFVENKGQWDNAIKFKSDFKGGALYLTPSGYKVALHDKDDMKKLADYFGGHSDSASIKSKLKSLPGLVLHSHAYDISFADADSNAVAVPDKPLSMVNNYFIGSDSSKWKTGCRVYNGITYKNVYKHIDVRYYSDNGNLKYDIIINPGADISRLALRYNGLDGLLVNKYGNLTMKTSVGEVYQSIPASYQIHQAVRAEVKAAFKLVGNTVRFKLDKYDTSQTLIIDPTEIFSSFTGSLSDNWGYTATYDNEGNFYAGGIVFDDGFDPRHVGGYDQTFNGGDASEGQAGAYDIALIKFNPTGSLALYATYFGGGGDEQPHSLVAGPDGNLIMSGRTSSTNFPTTASTYGSGGGFDIFLAKFSADGKTLLASRKFGGKGADGVNISPKYVSSGISTTRRNYGDDARSEVITDYQGNIYLASCTQSSDFPTTPNAFDKALGGMQDGVFIKASSDLTNVLTSTLIGGGGNDAAFVVNISNTTGTIYIAGGTSSTDLAVNATNVSQGIIYNSYQGGNVDGFIAAISSDGSTLLKICYVGGKGNDMVYGVQTDKFGYPYIMGTTTVSLPVYKSIFNVTSGQEDGKQFITKLNPGLTEVIYSANFGSKSGVPNISPTAFLVDICGNVYVSGWGGKANREYYGSAQNTVGMSTTANAISRQTDGNDFYFFVLEKDATSQLFGSFFGTFGTVENVFGDHVDGGTSRFDRRGVIYQAVCANCNKTGTFPTTTGSWSPGNPAQTGALCNEAAVKIAFELSGVIASIQPSINGVLRDSTGCIPLTVDFRDTIALGKLYRWDFGDGAQTTTTDPAASHTYNDVGDYKVRLISIDSSSCNIADTAYITIRARSNEAALGLKITKLLPCESFNYQFDNTSVPPSGYTFQADDFTWDFGDGATITTNATPLTHQYTASGVYNVKLYLHDTMFCNSPDSVVYQLRVASTLQALFVTPATGCAPYTAVFDNTSLGGQHFVWYFGDGDSSTEAYPTHLYQTPGTYTVTLTATDSLTCNPEDDTMMTITVYEAPVSSFIYSPATPTENTPYQFTNSSTGGVNYKWDFGDGDSLITTSMLPVSHIYNTAGSYRVCLIAFNQYGCSDTSCQQVTAIVTPVADVPNVFTPNGDGANDIVYVKGYGIDKMTWRIYNRWGKLVFVSTSLNNGWNGLYNGVLQPQDVYAYTLSIQFTDGTKYSKKGDITLLR
ncbi:PKD domain-containing protein [Parafilimonas sp.]|uniref:gliding motility-associated C-terminal domain-containing protein n=1 Tax=Parafilimonas sp. TaxID=1969739 RepID=UPI0039E54A29